MFKPKKSDECFDGRRNNYIEYISDGDDNKNSSSEEYLDIIRSYLKDLINDQSKSGEWKIQLVMLTVVFSQKFLKKRVLFIQQVIMFEWIKNKGATINPKNIDDNYCFKYAVFTALDYKDIGRNAHRISKIKGFISNYNWEGTEFPVGSKDWIKLEQNNETIALDILSVFNNTEEICHEYKSKYNNEPEN